MKRTAHALIGIFVIIVGLVTVGAQAQASSKTVSIAGVTVEYEDPIYCPMKGNRLDTEFSVVNGTGEELLSVNIEFLDQYGQEVTSGFLGSFKSGLKKTLSVTLYQYESSSLKCTDIAKMKVFVDFYSMSSKSDTSINEAIQVLQIGAMKPTPNVTPSATPQPSPSATIPTWIVQQLEESNSVVAALQSENKNLKAKLKRICGNKPKPKGC
jgi:hypothetical protein